MVPRLRSDATQAASDQDGAAHRPRRYGADADAQRRATRERAQVQVDRVRAAWRARGRALRRRDRAQLVPEGALLLDAPPGEAADPPHGRRLAGTGRTPRRRLDARG